MKDDLHFLRLWDLYSPLLTATQKEITDLYFNYDLSLGEIAEQKGVSRQSVSDCLQKCRKQLEKYNRRSNDIPKTCLGYRSPNEVLTDALYTF